MFQDGNHDTDIQIEDKFITINVQMYFKPGVPERSFKIEADSYDFVNVLPNLIKTQCHDPSIVNELNRNKDIKFDMENIVIVKKGKSCVLSPNSSFESNLVEDGSTLQVTVASTDQEADSDEQAEEDYLYKQEKNADIYYEPLGDKASDRTLEDTLGSASAGSEEELGYSSEGCYEDNKLYDVNEYYESIDDDY
ncbi:hypothetical protein GGI20_000451 [Coemansia sp. BCRC 34301]|nr:hypothetical protein GGI20_000451 [Coemansia sp. BCRC 34301]